MWNPSEIQNDIMRQVFNKCRNRLRISMYRTRNPIGVSDIVYPFSFLFIPGGRSDTEQSRYVGFKTIATPRNMNAEDGVSNLLSELEGMTYDLNIIVINTINNKEVGDAFYEYLKQTGATPLEQYTTVLTQSPYHRTQLVYDAETYQDGRVLNTYYLFTNKMNDIAIARLAGCICAYMNLFGESTGDIATALIQGKQAHYETIVTSITEALVNNAFRERLLETLTQASAYGKQRVINRLQSNINNKQENINRYIQQINQWYTDLRDLQTRLLGAQHAASDEDEFSAFLTANADNITYAKLTDSYLFMRYRTPLLYWDEDVFKILRESSNDNPLRPSNTAKQQLIDDIFSTRRVVLWFDSAFRYNLVNTGFERRILENDFSDVPAAKGLPNPHHYYYNCWGDNEPAIIAAQSRGDNVIAFAQIFAAIAGINLSDNVVLTRFIRDMWSAFKHVKCLELKETNEFISIEEYYARYHEAQHAAQAQVATPEVIQAMETGMPEPVGVANDDDDDWLEDL